MSDERTIVLRGLAEVERACTVLHGLPRDPDHPYEIVVRPHKKKRTLEQNKRYHAVCAEIADQLWVEGRQYDPETLKEYFKRLFIGTEELVFPDGRKEQRGISSTTLRVGEFADYMTKIDAWATARGVIFEANREQLAAYAEEARRWREREARHGHSS